MPLESLVLGRFSVFIFPIYSPCPHCGANTLCPSFAPFCIAFWWVDFSWNGQPLALAQQSLWLWHNKALGLTGIGLVLVAALLGGAQVPVGSSDSPHGIFGLDWFLLNLILYSIVYIPLERLFALHPLQPVFRSGWTTDLLYFFLNNLLVQATNLLTLTPAMIFFDWAKIPALVEWIGSLPLVVQVILAILVADFTQYWVHRVFHTNPMLWRFHAVHYSAQSMDWLAGARLHIVDVLLTRALTYVPIYLLGFSQTAVVIYVVVVVVVIQATFIHTNVHWKFRPAGGSLPLPTFTTGTIVPNRRL